MPDKINICLINPNTSASMTVAIEAGAKSVASSNTKIIAVNPDSGPTSIEGYYDEVFSLPGLITKVKEHKDADAFIIACFDDTGLAEARLTSRKPIIGIGQSAFHLAALRYGKFCVLTTLQISIPVIKQNIEAQGFGNLCKGVIASGIPVLELENNPISAADTLSECIKNIEAREPEIAVVLGCAGMTKVYRRLQARHDLYLLDPIVSSARMINAIL